MRHLMSNNSRLYNLQKLYEIENKDNGFIKEVVNLFLNTIPPTSKALVKAAKEKKWDDVYFLAHKMKANIDLLNIETIQTEIRLVEENAKSKINGDTLKKINFIHSIIEKVTHQLQEDFSK